MIKYSFIKILILSISVSCVYGGKPKQIAVYKPRELATRTIFNKSGTFRESFDWHLEKAEKNLDLIKQSRCYLAGGDLDNAMIYANEVSAPARFGQEKEFVELIKEFYNKGYTNIALNFAVELFAGTFDHSRGTEIIKLFFKEEDFKEIAIELLKKVGIGRSDIAKSLFVYLAIDLGQLEDAEKLAKEILDIWVNEYGGHLINDIETKLSLAKLISSSYYYDLLLEKYLASEHEMPRSYLERFIEDSSRLKVKKIHTLDKINSITDMLGSLLYLDPRSSERYDVSLESIQQLIETIFYEISKSSDISFSILHAIALDAKKNSLDICVYKREDDFISFFDVKGSYNPLNHRIETSTDININSSWDLKGTMIHELSHKLMDMLYANSAKPYGLSNNEVENAYQETINQLEEKLDKIKEDYNCTSSKDIHTRNFEYDSAIKNLLQVRESYNEEDQICEYIVRYPQSIANGTYDDPKVKELMQPLADFWNKFIQPDLEKYIHDNGGCTTFISDYARENILTPQFLDDRNTSGLKYKMNLESSLRFSGYKIGSLDVIHEYPEEYLELCFTSKAKGDLDLLKELKKKVPSLNGWHSLITEDPWRYFQIINLLKLIDDEDMIKRLKQTTSPDLTIWESIKVEDPSKYPNLSEALQEIYDNYSGSVNYDHNRVDLTVWKSIIAENSMNYFEIMNLFRELPVDFEDIPAEVKQALFIEMLKNSDASDMVVLQSRLNESGLETEEIIKILSENGNEDMAEVLKQELGNKDEDDGYYEN